jgi:antirestriction protein ArdC
MLLRYGGEYATFKQIKDAGGSVKKGEHGQRVYFTTQVEKTDELTGEVLNSYRLLKCFVVFNVATQCEGVEPKYRELWERGGIPSDIQDLHALEVLNSYASNAGLKVISAGTEAFYCPSDDTLQVPGCNLFGSREQYWHTMFHEAIHSTGHSKRLDRLTPDSFGSDSYAREELVADIGACLALGKLHIPTENCIRNTAGYVQGWSKKIKGYKPADLTLAIRQAEEAVSFIFNETKQETPNE